MQRTITLISLEANKMKRTYHIVRTIQTCKREVEEIEVNRVIFMSTKCYTFLSNKIRASNVYIFCPIQLATRHLNLDIPLSIYLCLRSLQTLMYSISSTIVLEHIFEIIYFSST